MRTATSTLPDGTVVTEVYDDADVLLSVEPVRTERQPAAVRARDAARGAVADWQLLKELYDTLNAGGQAYWNTIAPDAGLPATSGAYTTAMSFLTTRRDKAASRAVAALNRWRLA